MKQFLNKRGMKQGFNPWAGKRSAAIIENKNNFNDFKKMLEERQRRKPWGGAE